MTDNKDSNKSNNSNKGVYLLSAFIMLINGLIFINLAIKECPEDSLNSIISIVLYIILIILCIVAASIGIYIYTFIKLKKYHNKK